LPKSNYFLGDILRTYGITPIFKSLVGRSYFWDDILKSHNEEPALVTELLMLVTSVVSSFSYFLGMFQKHITEQPLLGPLSSTSNVLDVVLKLIVSNVTILIEFWTFSYKSFNFRHKSLIIQNQLFNSFKEFVLTVIQSLSDLHFFH
jgi:hypothetical protein